MDVALYALVSDDAKLEMEQPSDLKRVLRGLIGEVVEVIIRKRRSKRSDRQNKWWWGVAVEVLANECGYDRESMHYALVAKCFGTTHDDRTGLDIPNVRSSKLTTKQFGELMEWVVVFAATELDVQLPLPGEAEVA
jgi:hypothetical protein